MRIAQKHLDRLDDFKKNVEESCLYFKDNRERYIDFMRFVFETSISDLERRKLKELGKPPIEFNVLEAYISRLRGEFAKQEPGVTVRAADGVPLANMNNNFYATIEIVEGHLRQIFFETNNDALEYQIYSDLLGGGYSVAHVYTDYLNEMSFQQGIFVERVFDPVLCGFDPLARESHKGDGKYCFQLFPKTKNDFIKEYGEEKAKKIRFTTSSNVKGFEWSYQNETEEIVLICQYYEKQYKRKKIVLLANGKIMTEESYNATVQELEDEGAFEVAPAVLDTRWTDIPVIVRYDFCECEVLAVAETNYKFLPLVFFDGNSVVLRKNLSSPSYQMTRPYVYHAKGIQRLKNFSGQTVGAEIENMSQHRIMACEEGIPETWLDAYTDIQSNKVLVYSAFLDKDPSKPLPTPTVVPRSATPPIVQETFVGSDATTQAILGSYDAVLGVNSKQVSGVAIQQGAMQSNAAAIPYLKGYMKGINRIAEIILDLIPKYYVTPRSIPILKPDGKRSYQLINDKDNPQSINLMYDSSELQVKVEAGVNATVQKQVALDQIQRMMGASEVFAAFINSKGLETIIDNLDIRGVDSLKQQALEFMQDQEQAKQAAAQQQDPIAEAANTQAQAEVMRAENEAEQVQVQREKTEGELAVDTAKLAIEKQNSDIKFMEAAAKVREAEYKNQLKQQEIDAENARTAVEDLIGLSKTIIENRESNED